MELYGHYQGWKIAFQQTSEGWQFEATHPVEESLRNDLVYSDIRAAIDSATRLIQSRQIRDEIDHILSICQETGTFDPQIYGRLNQHLTVLSRLAAGLAP